MKLGIAAAAALGFVVAGCETTCRPIGCENILVLQLQAPLSGEFEATVNTPTRTFTERCPTGARTDISRPLMSCTADKIEIVGLDLEDAAVPVSVTITSNGQTVVDGAMIEAVGVRQQTECVSCVTHSATVPLP